MASLISLSALLSLAAAAPTSSQLTVKASTGYYTGEIAQNFSNVREFLSVPFGMSTGGANRWQPPVAVPLSSKSFNATAYPPACPQYVSAIPSIWNQKIPQYLQYWGNSNNSAGESAVFTSEDCLKLAIWTPANATAFSRLPVAMFWTGGGLQTNGILVPGQLPQRWVSRSQEHIVVTINYRMNIMGKDTDSKFWLFFESRADLVGFPNAAGLYDQNLGLMDQRLALEWVRDNIHYFGGDPAQITIWGQSSGAFSVDNYNYAYWDDPIARAIFAESGSALAFPSTWQDNSNFTFVAQHLGCNFPTNATQELECMQKVDYNDIIDFMGQYQDNQTLVNPSQSHLSFTSVPDERLVFSNYTPRYQAGMVSKVPMIYSSCANEGGSLQRYPVNNPYNGTNQSAANAITEGILCGAAHSTIDRHAAGLTTYRYQYAGNWSNQDPLPWMGAFHSSDLVMLFGAYTDGEGPCCEPLEVETSQTMEDYFLAFLKDPFNGPPSLGWYPMDPTESDGGTMIRFGADGKAAQNVTGYDVQKVCFGEGAYDPFP